MFKVAQWAHASEAAASLSQMAARQAKGQGALARLVRERQDLIGEWQMRDRMLVASRGQPADKRNAAAEATLTDRLAIIDGRIADINRTLTKDFPDYAAFAAPDPLSVAEVQAMLHSDEVLMLFLDMLPWHLIAEETFIWVVTKSEVRWVRSDLGTTRLTREVAALRCGLDDTAWHGKEGADNCAAEVGPWAGGAKPLPFSHSRAHALYKALFDKVDDLIKGKHLLIVPSGSLTQLPFHLLVTKGGVTDHRRAAWLARSNAITVLPAVSSLKALRRVGKPSAAPLPMIGFGNPLLDGPHNGWAKSAQLARDKQRCPDASKQQIATTREPRGGAAPVVTRGGLADLADLKVQKPLPETADELCAVARVLKADPFEMHLGARATEREVKALSAGGELAKYRVIHFATHGTLAGQLDTVHEPGLILTPPEKATEEDDGFLTASEIASLKLDADWIILSACNTAAGGTTGAEALSGLAQAFFYAQARALLVSHWEVNSYTTVKLVTSAVRDMALNPKLGRAEALRRAMLSLIDKGEPREAHPAYWAPFIVVGEGAAR
jgi:CHAT domain-containing protein